MKRIAVFTIAFVLITSSAFAMTAEDLAWYHNQNIDSISNLKAGQGSYDNYDFYICSVTDNIQIAYKIDKPTLVGGCLCFDESEIIEFIAQSMIICKTIGNENDLDRYYSVILRQFMKARNNEQTKMEDAGSLYINVSKDEYFYQLIASTKVF